MSVVLNNNNRERISRGEDPSIKSVNNKYSNPSIVQQSVNPFPQAVAQNATGNNKECDCDTLMEQCDLDVGGAKEAKMVGSLLRDTVVTCNFLLI
jgi:hypothetical protein